MAFNSPLITQLGIASFLIASPERLLTYFVILELFTFIQIFQACFIRIGKERIGTTVNN